jgi:hypothetical protein
MFLPHKNMSCWLAKHSSWLKLNKWPDLFCHRVSFLPECHVSFPPSKTLSGTEESKSGISGLAYFDYPVQVWHTSTITQYKSGIQTNNHPQQMTYYHYIRVLPLLFRGIPNSYVNFVWCVLFYFSLFYVFCPDQPWAREAASALVIPVHLRSW